MFNEKGYWLMQGDCLERMKEMPRWKCPVFML